MTQRAIIWENNAGFRSVADIVEWPEDRLDLNKRRLMRHLNRRFSGMLTVMIEQVDGPHKGENLYEKNVRV